MRQSANKLHVVENLYMYLAFVYYNLLIFQLEISETLKPGCMWQGKGGG